MEYYNDFDIRNRIFAGLMFIGTPCPGCGHIWNETDDLLHARTRASEIPEAWHDECIRKEHPELFEDENERR